MAQTSRETLYQNGNVAIYPRIGKVEKPYELILGEGNNVPFSLKDLDIFVNGEGDLKSRLRTLELFLPAVASMDKVELSEIEKGLISFYEDLSSKGITL